MNFINRRRMLLSGATALMLPNLESTATAAPSSSAIPKRLVFLTMGYGVNAANWFPPSNQTGTDYRLPPLLKSFADLKSDFSIIQNLTNRSMPNPHAGSQNFLTCADLGKDNERNTVSVDQLAAKVLGENTRHSSLAIAGAPQRADGHGSYASWGPDGKPVGLYRKLTDVYAALFGTGGKAHEIQAKLARQQSGLDAILGNAKRLNGQISTSDRHRVDEYFTSIRNIERRLSKAQDWIQTPYPDAPFPSPSDRIGGNDEIELVLDMMVTAMQSDSTRVMTYMMPTGRVLQALNSRLNPHKMSHRASGELDPEAIHQRRDRMLAELVSGFLRKLKNTKEADGSSLLDHSLIAYGSTLRQGHNATNLPMLLAGHGGGGLKQGQNVVYQPNQTPLANLWLSMLRHVGANTTQFANSNRILTEMGFS
ncbi:DUF1552 domain-containing protein [Rhodopirellula sallentina]|uniref:Secreted protein containing DUF1552 n=1 Tax=Rhodopirellula sallentina SM41 TaxID=1263870 RepID=M5TU93_9BACT|nr:DUF1552 domain-containing protein [Rhodopirellula sallentina]EMI52720.1 secreted protein containing DUF1552 [Rhodopirellula sallentina SM41]